MGFKSLRVHMPCDLSVLSDLTVLSFDFDHEREHTIPYHKYFLSHLFSILIDFLGGYQDHSFWICRTLLGINLLIACDFNNEGA